jgi:hypothetical protein
MSAFTVTSVLFQEQNGFQKTAIVTATGPSSYDTGGSVVDLSAGAVLSAAGALFTAVHAASLVGVGTAAAGLYDLAYIRAADGAPATGKFVAKSAATQVASTTDLSALTFTFRVQGR